MQAVRTLPLQSSNALSMKILGMMFPLRSFVGIAFASNFLKIEMTFSLE
jgi:hypothetical protein